jgi:putative ABC transport system permease protein
MIKNYLVIAYRNLIKNKTSSFINIFCLAVGMTCCMLIMVYIKDELSFNKFNEAYNDIYRVDLVRTGNDDDQQNSNTPMIYKPVMKLSIPQLKQIGRLYQRSGSLHLEGSDKKFQEQQVYFTDPEIFKIFSIKFIRGNQRSLDQLNTIVLTAEAAQKYFGSEDPTGKTLLFENKLPLKVTAVVDKMPSNSDLQFDFLISFDSYEAVENPETVNFLKKDWIFNPVVTYCILGPSSNTTEVEKLMNGVISKYGDQRSKETTAIKITPLKDIHLHSADVLGNPSTNSMTYMYIFAAIAFLILIIANVNFINLSTARASTRAREVGMRKVLGAVRSQLVLQFLGEALLLSALGFSLALALSNFTLPVLNQLTNKQFHFQDVITWQNMLLFGALFLIVGMLSGLYPAFFISRTQTVVSLKGRAGNGNNRNYLRKVLLVTQFSVSIILIVCAVIIYQQLDFIRSKPLGFQKEYVLNVPLFGRGASILTQGVDASVRKKMNAFSEELKKNSKIIDVTAASELPGQGFVPGLVIPEGHSETDNLFLAWTSVDYNFIEAFKIQLVEGRNFSKSTGTDHLEAFIINEAAAKEYGWKNKEAIGKTIIRGDQTNGKKGKIIGVIKDFHFNTLDQPMQGMIMDVSVARFTQLAIVIQPDHIPQTIEFIKNQWGASFPERVFEYSFIDSDINSLYRDKENLSSMIQYFAIIAIVLSCLGLFSLASYLSVQRTKEIGIRKILGASVSSVLILLSKEFLRLVAIALFISIPAAWLVMNGWLNNYAYKIEIRWWVFGLAGMAVCVITAFTVGLQSIKTAVTNPIKNLRTE